MRCELLPVAVPVFTRVPLSGFINRMLRLIDYTRWVLRFSHLWQRGWRKTFMQHSKIISMTELQIGFPLILYLLSFEEDWQSTDIFFLTWHFFVSLVRYPLGHGRCQGTNNEIIVPMCCVTNPPHALHPSQCRRPYRPHLIMSHGAQNGTAKVTFRCNSFRVVWLYRSIVWLSVIVMTLFLTDVMLWYSIPFEQCEGPLQQTMQHEIRFG